MNIGRVLALAALLIPMGAIASRMGDNAPIGSELETRGGGKLLSLDFQSSGDVAAFTMRVSLPVDAKRIDTSRCLADLPESWTGVCQSEKNFVAVTAYSTKAEAYPAGLLRIGKLQYQSQAKASAVIDYVEASKADGESASLGAAKVEKLD